MKKTPIRLRSSEALSDCLNGRAKANNVRQFIRFNTVVRHVGFNHDKNEFFVCIEDFNTGSVESLTFDRILVATGHYHAPNMIHIDGVDQFPGRVFHSHDFRGADEFVNLNVLIIGSRVSAEDIALHCHKFGPQSVTISARREPVELKWPAGIKTAPLTVRVEGRTAHFKDGTSVDNIDAITFCTGYRHICPFMAKRFQLHCGVIEFVLPNLYKGVFWVDQPYLAYLGATRYIYTFIIFEVQAALVRDVFLGRTKLPIKNERQDDINKWKTREKTTPPKSLIDIGNFQNDYIRDLLTVLPTHDENQYLLKFDLGKSDIIIKKFIQTRLDDFMSHRDKSYESVINTENTKTVQVLKPWIENFDDSIEDFLSNYCNE